MTHDFNSTPDSIRTSSHAKLTTLIAAVCLACICLVQAGCGGDDKAADSGYEAGDDSDKSSSDGNAGTSKPRSDGGSRSQGSTGSTGSPGGTGDSTGNSGGGSGAGGAGRIGKTGVEIAPSKPQSLDAESLDELTMPVKGTPKQLFQFINASMNQPVRSKDPNLEFKERLGHAVTATQEILVHADATPHDRLQAAQTKFVLLDRLANQFGVESAAEHLPIFAASLVKHTDEDVVNFGRLMVFQLNVAKAIDNGEGSFDDLAVEIGTLANDLKPSPQVFQNLVHATLQILRTGQLKPGRAALDSIVQVYGKEPEFAEPLSNMVERARYFELNLENSLRDYMEGKEEVAEALKNDTLRLLNHPNPALQTLQASSMIATGFERHSKYDAAQEIYAEIKRVYATTESAEIKKHVETLSAAAAARLTMVGQPIDLQGTTIQGAPFNWSEFKGKVVYVVFWSAADAVFVQSELPRLVKLHEVYKPHGFEIVGVNVDGNVAELKNFFNYQAIPWPTIVGALSEGNVTERFGVLALPYAVLVDAKGIVSFIHLDSGNLPQKLLATLGPLPEGAIPKDAVPKDAVPKETGETIAPPAGESGNAPKASPPNDSPAPDPQQDEKPTAEKPSDKKADSEKADKEKTDDEKADDKESLKLSPLEDLNPYLARQGMKASQLVEYILRMEDRPVGLRKRPGFKEAIVDASNRIEQSDGDEKLLGIAVEKKLKWLYLGSLDDDDDEKIEAMVKAARPQQDHPREAVRDWATLIVLEAEVLKVDALEIEKVKPLLERLLEYFSDAKLEEHHLRMASATIHAVNRIDVEEREEFFQSFGSSFQKSQSRKLASYGKKLKGSTEGGAMSELVGKPLEISGQTGLGTPIDWASYRGQYVLVDFWATWCGPCMRAAPDVRALYDRHHEAGFDVVGINLDRDPEALTKYLDKENPPWANVVGADAKKLSQDLGIRGIPALLLIDKEGKVIVASHSVSEIAAALKKAME